MRFFLSDFFVVRCDFSSSSSILRMAALTAVAIGDLLLESMKVDLGGVSTNSIGTVSFDSGDNLLFIVSFGVDGEVNGEESSSEFMTKTKVFAKRCT